jgi:hypothetical protein
MFDEIIEIDPSHRMTKDEVDVHELEIFNNFEDAGRRLLKIREERGWEAKGFKSFREYCESLDEKMSLRKAYYLVDQADVNDSLSKATGKVVRLPMRQTQLLKDLEPEQRLLAFQAATVTTSRPTEKVLEKAVEKYRPHGGGGGSSGSSSRRQPESPGWTDDDLKKDQSLAIAIGQMRGLWGNEDAKLIQNGTIGYRRADVIELSKLAKPKLEQIRDLVMANHWTPKQALEFVGRMPNEFSTVEDLTHWCLAEKGKFLQVEINHFTITVKLDRAVKR